MMDLVDRRIKSQSRKLISKERHVEASLKRKRIFLESDDFDILSILSQKPPQPAPEKEKMRLINVESCPETATKKRSVWDELLQDSS